MNECVRLFAIRTAPFFNQIAQMYKCDKPNKSHLASSSMQMPDIFHANIFIGKV